MFKSLIKFLTIALTIMVLILLYKIIGNIKIKKEIQEANEKYITKNKEAGIIEYKSETLHINIIPIKKSNPNIEMWEINIKINDGSQIKSAFARDEFSLTKKEKTSHIAMRHNVVLAINGVTARFNKRSYVIRDGIVYRDKRLDYDPLVIQMDGNFRIYNEQLIGEDYILMEKYLIIHQI